MDSPDLSRRMFALSEAIKLAGTMQRPHYTDVVTASEAFYKFLSTAPSATEPVKPP